VQLVVQLARVQISIVTKIFRAFSAFEMVEIISQNSKTLKKLSIGFEISGKSSAFYTF
jgi:hypothetical protein